MVAALELQDLVPPPEGASRPHREHRGLSPAGAEPDLVGAGDSLHHLLSEKDRVFGPGEECAAQLELLTHRGHHLRMGVTNEHWAGPEQVVDVLIAAHVPDPCTPPFLYDDICPEVAEAASGQVLVGLLDQSSLSVRYVSSRHSLLLSGEMVRDIGVCRFASALVVLLAARIIAEPSV